MYLNQVHTYENHILPQSFLLTDAHVAANCAGHVVAMMLGQHCCQPRGGTGPRLLHSPSSLTIRSKVLALTNLFVMYELARMPSLSSSMSATSENVAHTTAAATNTFHMLHSGSGSGHHGHTITGTYVRPPHYSSLVLATTCTSSSSSTTMEASTSFVVASECELQASEVVDSKADTTLPGVPSCCKLETMVTSLVYTSNTSVVADTQAAGRIQQSL